MLLSLLVYALCGVFVGLIAGLLGLGGGVVLVPMLLFVFPWQGIPPELVQHMALGTSFATIVFTSFSSARAHQACGTVRWDVFRHITPGIILGTFGGGLLASHFSSLTLKVIFICFLFMVSAQMIANYRPPASRNMPSPLGTALVGLGIGLISSFVGIAGGTLLVPFMTFCNMDAHKAIGTSAAIGLPVAVAGTISYSLGGWNLPDLPPYSLGYINLVAFAGIVATSFLIAPFGARLSQKLPTLLLKRIFACILLSIAVRMAWGLLGSAA